MSHAVVAPVVLPAVSALVMLLLGERLVLQRAVGLASCAALLALGVHAVAHASSGTVSIYQLGDWPAPFGIVLVLDRLAALMLALVALVALLVLVAAVSGEAWDARGRHFHAFFQLQLMGLDGAFLTGDLFNLFVFFEVLLLASYCLLQHGRGAERLRAGVHYVAVNLAASALFLICIGVLYGLAGTLNMSDLALRLPELPGADAALVRAAALLLLVVFGVKAALFPLNLWLPRSYAAAAPPVAALFAIMTKVGVYAILRVHGSVLGSDTAAQEVGPWLLAGALLSTSVGVLGAFAARTLGAMTAYLTIASVGTVLIAVSRFSPETLAAAIYYLVHSTLSMAALFLLAGRIAEGRGAAGDRLEPGPPLERPAVVGVILLVAAVTVVGLPPLSGFLAKLMILQASAGLAMTPWVWGVILASSFVAMVGFVRAGSALVWTPAPAAAGVGRVGGLGPAIALLGCAMGLALLASPAQRYAAGAAAQLTDARAHAAEVLREVGPRTTRPLASEARP